MATKSQPGNPGTGQRHLGLAMGLCLECLVGMEVIAETLVPAGATWRFLDDGSDPGTAWREPAFDDCSWAAGPAQLGYGESDESTRLSFGADATNKIVTTYFRHTFVAVDPGIFTHLTLSLLRDDGAAVYVNGREVFRSNLPAGSLTYRTLASSSVGGTDEKAYYPTPLAVSHLVAGTNVLAVEVHQVNATSSDLSFDLQLEGNLPPIQVIPDDPAPNAINVPRDSLLRVAIPETQGQELTLTFYGRLADPAPGSNFTLIALPDTQYYVSSKNGGAPSTFAAQTEWIVTNQAALNIAFVTQLGDCVENGDNGGNDVEWQHAANALYRLENPLATLLAQGLPYGVAVGNHDQSPKDNPQGTTRFYNQYFGESHFAGRGYYGGHYGTNNDNHFELFSAGGLDFIAIHLEYDTAANTNVLAWANALLQTNLHRRGVVISHWLLNAGNPGTFSAQGRATYEALKGNSNLFLMLCGHDPAGESRRQDTFNGHTIHTLLSDYQGRTNGGSGWLRILEFSPNSHLISVKTYTPTFNQFETDPNSQFTIEYDMNRFGPLVPWATVTGIGHPTNVAVGWAGLADATTYEWRVAVTYGTNTVTSPLWRFTTASNVPPSVVVSRADETLSAGGEILPSVTLAIEATAADTDGAVTRVEFYKNGARLGHVSNAPYSHTWTHVPVGLYTFTAVAEDNGGLRATSAPVQVVVSLPPEPDTLPLAAPTALRAVVLGADQIALNWTDASDGETGFAVERSLDGMSFSRVALVPANTEAFSDTGLLPATRYFYRVYAFDATHTSAYSESATATTALAAAPGLQLHIALNTAKNTIQLTWPTVPGSVYRVVDRPSIADLAWTDASDDIAATDVTATWDAPIDPGLPHRFYAVRQVR